MIRCRSRSAGVDREVRRCERRFFHSGMHGAGPPYITSLFIRDHFSEWSDYAGRPRFLRWFRDSRLEETWTK